MSKAKLKKAQARWKRRVDLVRSENGKLELSVRVIWPKRFRKGKESGVTVRYPLDSKTLQKDVVRAIERPETTCPRWRPPLHTNPLKPPAIGDEIYISGSDDIMGGLATVYEVENSMSAGKMVPFVKCYEAPGHRYNWEFLAEYQEENAKIYGLSRAHKDNS